MAVADAVDFRFGVSSVTAPGSKAGIDDLAGSWSGAIGLSVLSEVTIPDGGRDCVDSLLSAIKGAGRTRSGSTGLASRLFAAFGSLRSELRASLLGIAVVATFPEELIRATTEIMLSTYWRFPHRPGSKM